MKNCGKCKKCLQSVEFNKNKTTKTGLTSYCKQCSKIYGTLSMRKWRMANPEASKAQGRKDAKHRRRTKPEVFILNGARNRAKAKGLEFNLVLEDIIIPSHCPVLGIELEVHENFHGHSSPTIDRIDNTQGYIKNNIIIISYRANWIKTDASIDELEKIVTFYKQYILRN